MTNDTPQSAYHRRIESVSDYICCHLQENLSVDHFQYVVRMPQVQEHEQVTDIYLPLL